MLQALLKEDQATYATVSVLEGMDAFKSYMEGYDVFKSLGWQRIIVCQQLAHLTGNVFRECGIIAANLVGQFLVLPYCEPILAAIAGAGLQDIMQFFDKFLSQRRACLVDHHIIASKMVSGLNHIRS